MKVVHVNSSLGGGAATAARRLHDSLARYGVESRFWYASGVPPDPTYVPYSTGAAAFLRKAWESVRLRTMAPYLWRRAVNYEMFSDSRWLLPMSPRALNADILHLHWTAGFLDYSTFFGSLPPDFPLVWTLHDMHPFTGGCHYSFGCERFTGACGQCPQLNRLRSETDPSRRNFELKRNALHGRNLHVVADSRWLEGEARRSAIFAQARSFRTIHYGLDTRAFPPKPMAECRRGLGLPEDAFIVCFGSQTLANPRKGTRELMEAFRRLGPVPRLTGLAFGAGTDDVERDGLPPIRCTGPLHSAEELATVYCAADIFVIPSLAEAFGQTAMEAMACGRPVVGFDTGGIPDIVRPQRTGLLAAPGDTAQLADAIAWMMEHRAEREAMGRNARAMVETDFTLERQARQYIDLYRSLINDAR